MSNDELERLLDLYESHLAAGNKISAIELCQDCPELLGPVQEKIDQLNRFQAAWCNKDAPPISSPVNISNSIDADSEKTLNDDSALGGRHCQTTSQFVLQRKHATGGLGEVYAARDLDANRQVAIKFLKAEGHYSPELVARFQREARIAASLDHPGVAPVLAIGHDDRQTPFYAMRLVGGKTLQATLEEIHRLPAAGPAFKAGIRRLLTHFISICQTVAFAHSRGIVHRDLKPLNIMLGDYGETIVVDWGLAKQIGSETDSTSDPLDSVVGEICPLGYDKHEFRTTDGTVSGTIGYMSPEQAQGDIDSISARSDIYSLGGILFAIMTGKSVFAGVSSSEAILRTQKGNIPSPSVVNPRVAKSLEAICLKAMAYEPVHRYQSAMELALDVEHFLADEPVSARRESILEWAGRILRRHRQLTGAFGVALLLTTVTLSVGLLLLNRQRRETALARDGAISNLETAISAIDGLYTEISEHDLLNEPGAEELRRRLLGKAALYYQRLQQRTQDSAYLEFAAAQALFHVAEITAQVESPDRAIPIYKSAIGQLERLRNSSDESETCLALATAYNGLARAHFELQQFDLANSHYEQSLLLLRALPNSNQAVRSTNKEDLSVDRNLTRKQLRLLGGTLNSRGSSYLSQSIFEQALSDYDTAGKILEELVSGDPNDVSALKTLAANQSNRAVALRMLRKNAEVVAMYEAALNSYGRAGELDSQDDEAQAGRAKTEFNLANFLSATGDQQSAIARFDSASRVFDELCRDFPLRVSYRINYAKVLLNQGIAFARLEQLESAEGSFEEAIKRFQAIRLQYPVLFEPCVDLVQAYQNLGNLIAGDELDRDPKRALKAYNQSIALGEEILMQNPPVPVAARLKGVIELSRQYRDACESVQNTK